MAYSSLTITRDDINSYEGVTFSKYNDYSGTLGLDISDTQVLAAAKREMKTDLIDDVRDLYENGTYESETAVLDALYAADSDSELEVVLTFKFLELWFKSDSDSMDSLSWENFKLYHQKYLYTKQKALRRLRRELATPASPPTVMMRSQWS